FGYQFSFLCFFNSFILHFLQLAGITGLGGSFFLHKYKVYGVFFSSIYIILPANLAIAGGVVLLISGCIGCSVLCIFSLLCGALWVLLLYWHILIKGSQDPDTKAVNALQREVFLQCCGVKNYTDWLETPWFNHSGKYEVPLSCCNNTFHSCNGTLDSPQLLYNEVQILFTFELPYLLDIILILSCLILQKAIPFITVTLYIF
uniref:Tetraspanin 37 n=1 Tax=Cyprinus carpio TaxID=7962 RepID=A0A8C1WZT3_CYPCA